MFAGVLAAEKLRMPWVSTVLSPIVFLSAYDPPVPPPAPWLVRFRALGPGFMKRIWDIGRRESLRWVEPVLDLRRAIGLPAGRHPIFEGSHSPSLVLALFSHWLAEPQPDWPPNTVVTGFPFFRPGSRTARPSPGLERFFNEGAAPIVFTLGSSAVGAAGAYVVNILLSLGLSAFLRPLPVRLHSIMR